MAANSQDGAEFMIGDTVKIIGGECMGKQGILIDRANSPGFWHVRVPGQGDWVLYRSVMMLEKKVGAVEVSAEKTDTHAPGVKLSQSPRPHSHYFKDVSGLKSVDVYRVLDLFGVTHPCAQHAIKKLLMAGQRGGGKDLERDVREAGDTINRWLQMIAEG